MDVNFPSPRSCAGFILGFCRAHPAWAAWTVGFLSESSSVLLMVARGSRALTEVEEEELMYTLTAAGVVVFRKPCFHHVTVYETALYSLSPLAAF